MSTNAPIRVLAVSGSLREASFNRRLVRLAAALGREMDDVEIVEFDALRAVEPFDEDSEPEGTPPGAAAFWEALRSVDAVFIATPEYNGSIPGTLKNALDWASRAPSAPFNELQRSPMYGMPVAVASSSTGQFGGVWARDELVKSLKTQGARAVVEPQVAVVTAHTAFDDEGGLLNAATTEKLGELLGTLVTTAIAVRRARAAKLAKA